jgi:hypothetical protein
MPKTRVSRLAQRLAETKRWKLPVPADSPPSIYLSEHMVIAFQVSSVAASVRLKQIGFGRVEIRSNRAFARRSLGLRSRLSRS